MLSFQLLPIVQLLLSAKSISCADQSLQLKCDRASELPDAVAVPRLAIGASHDEPVLERQALAPTIAPSSSHHNRVTETSVPIHVDMAAARSSTLAWLTWDLALSTSVIKLRFSTPLFLQRQRTVTRLMLYIMYN